MYNLLYFLLIPSQTGEKTNMWKSLHWSNVTQIVLSYICAIKYLYLHMEKTNVRKFQKYEHRCKSVYQISASAWLLMQMLRLLEKSIKIFSAVLFIYLLLYNKNKSKQKSPNHPFVSFTTLFRQVIRIQCWS